TRSSVRTQPVSKPKAGARKRRRKGEGALFVRPNGSWAAVFSFRDPITGERKRRWITAPTEAALKRRIADKRAEGGGSIGPAAEGTFGEWVTRWLDNEVAPNLAPNTVRNYRDVWRLHAAEHLGNVKLEAFGVEHVDALFAILRKHGASNSVLLRTTTILSRAVEVAIRRRVYLRANPFKLVERPKHRAAEARALDPKEARA
ncbi:MAG: hypothetical protein ACREQ5_33105, partial [Candidatus Dormibacteria bacterium]